MPLDMHSNPLPRPAPVNPLAVYFPHEFIGYAVDHSSEPVLHTFKSELFHCQTFDSSFCFASGSLSVGHIAENRRDAHRTVSQIGNSQTLFLYIPFKPFAVKIVQCIIPPFLSPASRRTLNFRTVAFFNLSALFHVVNSPIPPIGSLFFCNYRTFVKGLNLHPAHNAVAY